jgi:AcrR family transcriptional regulator
MRSDAPAPASLPRVARVRDPIATRRAIVDAAHAVMAERGPHGVTVSDVARRARVNRGTAYQHFPSRELLVAAVLEDLGRSTKSALDATAAPDLDQRIDQTIEYFVRHPELVRVSLFRMLAGVPHPDEGLWLDYRDRMRRFGASAGTRDGIDADMLAVILLGATMLWSLRVHSGAESAAATARYARELKRLLLYGAVLPSRHGDLVRAAAGGRGSARRARGAARSGEGRR